MAGRPPLRIGEYGNISRRHLGNGVWIARCRYRDTDGVTRKVQRRSPGFDQHGKGAVDALKEALSSRQAPTVGEINLDTRVTVLVDAHIDRLQEDDRSGATIETYRRAAVNWAKLIKGLRIGEATPPRIDTALRSMRTTHG